MLQKTLSNSNFRNLWQGALEGNFVRMYTSKHPPNLPVYSRSHRF
jgi:hypothetical protein